MMTATDFLKFLACTGAALATLVWPEAARAAPRTVDEHRPAEAAGQVEIQNVAGRIEVVGWDKSEVAVSGVLGADVARLDITSTGSRTSVHVISEGHGASFSWSGTGGETRLVVHVPARSSLAATLVSADVSVTGVAGDQELHTVSGGVTSSAQHEVRVNTVSGDVHLTAGPESRRIEVSTVSGDLTVSGGSGELAIATVSGDGTLTTGSLSRAHVKTVSGDFSINADLAPDGRLEAESVSGNYRITFAGALPPAVFDLQSFSGDLSTCSGRKAAHEGYGPGSRLSFQEGAGSARVRVDTKSGDVTLCSKK
jgi:Putative adhesin